MVMQTGGFLPAPSCPMILSGIWIPVAVFPAVRIVVRKRMLLGVAMRVTLSVFRIVSHGDQSANVVVTQPKAAPDHTSEDDGENDIEERAADTNVRGHRAAEIARQQDRSQSGRARN